MLTRAIENILELLGLNIFSSIKESRSWSKSFQLLHHSQTQVLPPEGGSALHFDQYSITPSLQNSIFSRTL